MINKFSYLENEFRTPITAILKSSLEARAQPEIYLEQWLTASEKT